MPAGTRLGRRSAWPRRCVGRTEGSEARQAHQNAEVFPIGVPNDRFAKYFIGQSYLVPVSTEQVKIFNVGL